MVSPKPEADTASAGASANRLRLVLLGPPGAGKGTLAEVLARRLRVEHWATGDLLRLAVRNGGVLGAELKRYIDSGELVPDELVIRLLLDRMSDGGAWQTGFILDGFPRTVEQARQFDMALQRQRLRLDLVFHFATSTPVIINRLSGRRVCPRCQKSYHVRNIPPKKPGVCDQCGESLVQREDDREATVRHRLEIYGAESALLLQYYQERGLLAEVNGDWDIELLYRTLISIFDRRALVTSAERDSLLAATS